MYSRKRFFEGAIRDNLKYGAGREVTDEEIEAAAKSVCADAFIQTMPGGYNMMYAALYNSQFA